MTLDERLQFCKVCNNRKMDFNAGMLCKLTNSKPDFEEKCPSFDMDSVAAKEYLSRKEALAQSEQEGGFFAAEKKGFSMGMLGGLLMMAIAAVWFFVGMAAGYIYFYPPILFVMGIVALIKGMADGNVAGNK
jgi:hypothetical protein